ncbi:MAG: hypothetical protein KL787_00185 [Taibaiella sp.]|nr:hypothetical protein [Taibaiella sp.]
MLRTSDGEQSVYTWKFNDIKAKDTEDFQYNPDYDLPKVIIGIENFKVLGTVGSSSDWTSLGEWVAGLNTNRQEISNKTKEEIHHLIQGVDAPRAQAKLIYEYFQNKIRYISIQEGIGSWQPMKAYDVDANLYGDCKALSNYMKTLLSIAGISSDYALINAGKNNTLF